MPTSTQDQSPASADAPDVGRGSEAPPGLLLPGLAGAVAAALALAVSELAAGLFTAVPSLVLAVGNAVVDVGAGSRLKQVAIALFGTNDKTALLVGTVVLSVLFGAVLGVLARRLHFRWGLAGLVGFATIGVAATAASPLDSTVLALIPAVLAVATGAATLWWLLGVDSRIARAGATARGRREFLRIALGVGAVAGLVGAFGRSLSTRAIATVARDGVVLPSADLTAAPVAAGTSFEGIDGLSPLFTPNEDFYRIDTALTTPMVDVEDWSLRIHGLVGEEVVLTYDDLLAMEQIEADVTIACVSNEVGGGLIGNARWQGVRLSDLLALAGVDATMADQVVGRSVDGWTAGFPTGVALDGRNAMVALAMNDEPLPLAHGFPARLIVPGLYGYVSATKWLAEIELTTWEAFDGYWVPRGWSKEGPIKTQSRIDVPSRGELLTAGEVVIAGVAWAQQRGIRRVEVSVDEGEWLEAELAEELNPDTWRQWRLRWDAPPGDHAIRVRATDGEGMTQSAARVPVAPDGAEGYHTRSVRVA